MIWFTSKSCTHKTNNFVFFPPAQWMINGCAQWRHKEFLLFECHQDKHIVFVYYCDSMKIRSFFLDHKLMKKTKGKFQIVHIFVSPLYLVMLWSKSVPYHGSLIIYKERAKTDFCLWRSSSVLYFFFFFIEHCVFLFWEHNIMRSTNRDFLWLML